MAASADGMQRAEPSRQARRRMLFRAVVAAAGSPWLLSACAGPTGLQDGSTEPGVAEVAPGVFLLRGAGGEIGPDNLGRIANIVFIVGPRGVLVINSGVSLRHGQAVLATIRQTTRQPVRQLLLTHVRQEFLFGTGAFQAQGIPVLMHPAAARLMMARCDNCLKQLQRALGADEMAGTRVPTADLTVDPQQPGTGSMALADIGRPLRLLSAGRQGHSSGPGDLALLDQSTGSLVAAGWADHHSIPDVQDADFPGWRAALAQAADLRPQHVLPGHGPAGDASVLADTGRYLDQLEQRTADLLKAGTALSDVADAATLPEFADWDHYDTVHRRNAALIFLRHERALLQQSAR